MIRHVEKAMCIATKDLVKEMAVHNAFSRIALICTAFYCQDIRLCVVQIRYNSAHCRKECPEALMATPHKTRLTALY
jgi:hypothetical protein